MRKLPIGSKTYQYGFNAIEEILKDANIIKNEEIKIECYNKFTKNGLAMEKLDFENLFNEILKK
jgi:hypothetical protein